jgi:hypothetical protein
MGAGATAKWAALTGLLLLGSGCAVIDRVFGPSKIDEEAARAFITQQEAAWNAHDFQKFYALCAPEAQFTTKHVSIEGRIDWERHNVAEDWAAASAFFAAHSDAFREQDAIDRIDIAADGMSAHVVTQESAELGDKTRKARFHATTEQTLVLRHGRILSLGENKTTTD